MTTAKKKYDPIKRKRDAQRRNFESADLPGKFRIIKRQKIPAVAFRFFHLLTTEEQLQFVKAEFKGVKVGWKFQLRRGLQFSPTVKLIDLGYSLEVWPKIGSFRYNVTLIRTPNKFKDEQTLEVLQKYLPTVKVL